MLFFSPTSWHGTSKQISNHLQTLCSLHRPYVSRSQPKPKPSNVWIQGPVLCQRHLQIECSAQGGECLLLSFTSGQYYVPLWLFPSRHDGSVCLYKLLLPPIALLSSIVLVVLASFESAYNESAYNDLVSLVYLSLLYESLPPQLSELSETPHQPKNRCTGAYASVRGVEITKPAAH